MKKGLLILLLFLSINTLSTVCYSQESQEQSAVIEITKDLGESSPNKAKQLIHKKEARNIRSLKNINNGDIYTMDFNSENNLDELRQTDIPTLEDLQNSLNTTLFLPESQQKLNTFDYKGNALITKTAEKNPLYGRNYDTTTSNPTIIITSNPRRRYKNITINDGSIYGYTKLNLDDGETDLSKLTLAPFYTIDGMNEKGLIVSVFKTNSHVFQQNKQKGIQTIEPIMSRVILERCATVNDSIRLLKRYNMNNGAQDFKIVVVDEKGHHAIMNYNEKNRLCVNKKSNIIDKNFSARQDQNYTISTEEETLQYLLSTVASRSGMGSKTNWSVLFNSKSRKLYITTGENFYKIYSLEMVEPEPVEETPTVTEPQPQEIEE